MRKRSIILIIMSALLVSLTACNKSDTQDVVETSANIPVESSEVLDEETEEYIDYVEPEAETSNEGLVYIEDIRDETLQNSVLQAKNGLRQLSLSAGISDVNAEIAGNRDALFETLGITQEDLLKLNTQEDLSEYLKEKGLTEDQIYCYSIYSYLLDALEKGDSSEEENLKNYLQKTKDLLSVNGLSFDELINTRSFSELKTSVEHSGLSLYELNCKLWVNDIFPGVDVDAAALLEASTPEDFLSIFTESGISVESLEKQAAEPNKAKELVNVLKEIEKESKAAEESKGGSGSGSSTGTVSKSDVKESLSNKETETIPDNGGENTVTVIVGNDGSSVDVKKDNDTSSSNTSGNATVKVGDDNVKVKIIVKKILCGDNAIAEINSSNTNLPGHIDTDDVPDDYEWVAVKFAVKYSDSNSDTASLRPLVRVKNLSGANIETVGTHVYYIMPEFSSDDGDYRTYWVAFMLPDNQSKFMLYFGDTSGSVYKFKSTALLDD